MIYKLVNKRSGELISGKAFVADSFFKRFLGLMFRKSMDLEEALIFHHTNSVHTCFMRFAIDVVFLDKNMQVCKIYQSLKPWRLAGSLPAKMTVEFPANKLSTKDISIGDTLSLEGIDTQ